MKKIDIPCEQCGAPVDRSEDGTLWHTWDDPYGTGSKHVGLMVGYRCTNPNRHATLHSWGKLRVVIIPKER